MTAASPSCSDLRLLNGPHNGNGQERIGQAGDGGVTIITGHEGGETIGVHAQSAINCTTNNTHLAMTDFDPTEDVSMVDVFQSARVEVGGVEVLEAPE